MTDTATALPTGRLGRSGVLVSRLTLGTMNFGGPTSREDSIAIIRAAIDAGITVFDTADAYQQGLSEEILGEAIQGQRDDLIVATKFHNQIGSNPLHAGNSRRWIARAVDDSLRRLGVEHLDLYQAHRPDPHTDLLETLSALSDLVHQGKILYYGTSTFSTEDVVAAQYLAREHHLVAPLTEQLPYSALIRLAERTTLPVARRYGLGVLTYGPLAAGWLSGGYRQGAQQPESARAAKAWPGRFTLDDPANAAKLVAADRLAVLADEAGLTLPTLALAFALNHPDVSSVIVGPRTREHLDAYVAAANIVLDDDLLDEIDLAVAPGTTFLERDNGRIPVSLTPAGLRRGRP